MENRARDSHARDTGVLIVDRHPIVRLGLTGLLETVSGVVCVGEATTGGEAQAALDRAKPHVIVVEETLPDMDGLELVKRAKSRNERVGVVVLSEHTDRDFCVRAMRAGASAFLARTSSGDDIVRGIRCAAIGRRFVSQSLMDGIVSRAETDVHLKPHELLSDREFQVFRRLTAGERISEIARALCLSIKTVSTYRTRLLQKLELPSTAHLVRYAIEHGLT